MHIDYFSKVCTAQRLSRYGVVAGSSDGPGPGTAARSGH
jgi:hypothetical protein